MVDHRASPGLGPKGSPLGEGSLFEAATYTCSHCQKIVVLNPIRIRERGYCPKCDHYICDLCEAARVAASGDCHTWDQKAIEIQEKATRDEGRND